MKTAAIAMCAMLVATAVMAQSQPAGRGAAPAAPAEPAAPAPPPGSAGILKANTDLQAALKQAIAKTNDMAASPIALTDRYRVNIVHRPKANGAIAHPATPSCTTSSTDRAPWSPAAKSIASRERPAGSATIEGGETHKVTKGDVVIVPAGSAHMYSEVNGEITYLEVRFIAPK